MKFDIDEMVKSKEAFRQKLVALPIADKLRLLDAMRERALAIQGTRLGKGAVVREEATHYRRANPNE